jgi:hypothetical protein
MSIDADNGYRLVSAVFLRLLGVIYLIAFASIGVQIEGLVGSQGILPISEQLIEFAANSGYERYFKLPTLFWLNASDVALNGAAIAGCVAAVFIILQRFSRPALIVAFVLYLSLFHASHPFMNFQWDSLLLETGLLAIFLTPQSRVVILLFRWLLFRLRFMSGISKLSVGDPAWANGTALDSYFEVQPLPNPIAWYMHQLPEWLLHFGTFSTLVIEILVPLMMFLPRRWRFTAAWITIFWQVLIILTSNHNWINFLTIILCLFLFDDRALRRVVPEGLQARLDWQAAATCTRAKQVSIAVLAAFILVISTLKMYELATMYKFTGVTGKALNYALSYSVANKYHVFPTMTTERIELELLGSQDGIEWHAYAFKYKPDALNERPQFIIPHQPRLDWQMWFVTLHPRHMPWFVHFLDALLQNSPAVTALLQHNPFPETAPRYIRVDAYRYHFTTPAERNQTGDWWRREPLGPFSPLPWVAQPDR